MLCCYPKLCLRGVLDLSLTNMLRNLFTLVCGPDLVLDNSLWLFILIERSGEITGIFSGVPPPSYPRKGIMQKHMELCFGAMLLLGRELCSKHKCDFDVIR
jgi:hypothetical protein